MNQNAERLARIATAIIIQIERPLDLVSSWSIDDLLSNPIISLGVGGHQGRKSKRGISGKLTT